MGVIEGGARNLDNGSYIPVRPLIAKSPNSVIRILRSRLDLSVAIHFLGCSCWYVLGC